MSTSRLCVLCGCFIVGSAASASAQDAPLARMLVDFLTEAVQMTSGAAGTAGNPHEAHFIPGLNATRAPHELHKAIVGQLSTFPLGTSSGGFTYTLDPSTGAITPGSTSFGPSFAERPLTIGRGKFSAGVQYQHVEYDSFEDADLGGQEIGFLLQHNNCCPPTDNNPAAVGNTVPFFEGDLVETRYALNVQTDTTVVYANVGVASTLELGVAVPFVRTRLQIGGTSSIMRLSTANAPTIHSWDGRGGTIRDFPARNGSASGLGDVVVRGKVAFVPGALGAAIDLRLPTGDEAELLGTGGVQTRVMFIGSAPLGRISPHVNIGYVFSNGTLSSELTEVHVPAVDGSAALGNLAQPTIDLSVPDEFVYTAGFDWAASRRVTIAADVIGRMLRGVSRFEQSDSTFQYRTANDAPLQTATRPQFNLRTDEENLNLVLGAVGAKVNIATNLLLTANVLFPVTSGGLRPQITPVIGFDYAF